MPTINVHEAKTHLSRYLAEVERGGEVTIARAGKPVAKLVPVADGAPRETGRRLGGLAGMFKVPDDIDTMFEKDIDALFHGEDDGCATSSTPTS